MLGIASFLVEATGGAIAGAWIRPDGGGGSVGFTVCACRRRSERARCIPLTRPRVVPPLFLSYGPWSRTSRERPEATSFELVLGLSRQPINDLPVSRLLSTFFARPLKALLGDVLIGDSSLLGSLVAGVIVRGMSEPDSVFDLEVKSEFGASRFSVTHISNKIL